jgi:hypothetical protein
MATLRARLARTSFVAALLVGTATLSVAACDDFSSTPTGDAGAETNDAAAAFDATPTSDADAAAPDAAEPFCAALPPVADGGARFCDDFDQDPGGGRRLAGWLQDFADAGARGTFTPSDLSAPFAYRVEVPKAAGYLSGTITHTVAPPGRAFRVSFQMRGAQPLSGMTFAVITLGNPVYDAFLELRPGTAADRVGVAQRRIGPDGGYQSTQFSVPNSAGIRANGWVPVVIDIDAAAIRMQVAGDVGQATPLAPQVGPSPITLRLGAIVENGLGNTDIAYDNVLIETRP